MSQNLPYRPNVCMLLFNKEFKLFLGERKGERGIWQFPQGGIDNAPDERDAVLRELYEELGLNQDKLKIVKRMDATHEYDFRVVPPYAAGKWRGQAQSFWLVEFIGEDSDINVNTEHPEFMNWRWTDLQRVRDLADPIRAKGYKPLLDEFDAFVKSRES